MLDLVRNPNERFSHEVAHINIIMFYQGAVRVSYTERFVFTELGHLSQTFN